MDGMLERGLERKFERELGMVVWSCVVLGYRVQSGYGQGFVVMKRLDVGLGGWFPYACERLLMGRRLLRSLPRYCLGDADLV